VHAEIPLPLVFTPTNKVYGRLEDVKLGLNRSHYETIGKLQTEKPSTASSVIRSNWWIPNHAGIEAMFRSAGLRVTGRPGPEIYLCEPDPARPSCAATWNAADFCRR